MNGKTKKRAGKKSPLAPLGKILKRMGHVDPSDALPLLQAIEEAYGYLPADIVRTAARRTGVAESQLYGVATFYSQFHFEPHGRHTIRVCRGTACYVRGAPRILDAVQTHLNIKDGGTTDDMVFTLESVACLGCCAISPAIMIDDTYYGKMDPRKVEKTLEQYRKEAKK